MAMLLNAVFTETLDDVFETTNPKEEPIISSSLAEEELRSIFELNPFDVSQTEILKELPSAPGYLAT